MAEMREKNLDLMRQDIVSVLKNSSMAFVRELVGADPVAVFRWAILRAFFRSYFAFRDAGAKHRKSRNESSNSKANRISRCRNPNESILRYLFHYIIMLFKLIDSKKLTKAVVKKLFAY